MVRPAQSLFDGELIVQPYCQKYSVSAPRIPTRGRAPHVQLSDAREYAIERRQDDAEEGLFRHIGEAVHWQQV